MSDRTHSHSKIRRRQDVDVTMSAIASNKHKIGAIKSKVPELIMDFFHKHIPYVCLLFYYFGY